MLVLLDGEGETPWLCFLKDKRPACRRWGRVGHFPSHLHSSISRALQRRAGSHTTHSSPASLGTFSLNAPQQRLATSFLLLFNVLSLEQRQHRSGMLGIGTERCWVGDNNSYHLRLLYVPLALYFLFFVLPVESVFLHCDRRRPITYERLYWEIETSVVFLWLTVRFRFTNGNIFMKLPT